MSVEMDRLGADLRITGADALQGSSARLWVNGDRFVVVYISPKLAPNNQRPAANPLPSQFAGPGAIPTPTPHRLLQPTPTNRHSNADADADADRHSDVYSNVYPHADADANRQCNAYSNIYPHADADANRHSDAYSNIYPHADA